MPAPRSCLRCNAILAHDNKGRYCSPCERERWVPAAFVPGHSLLTCAIAECNVMFKGRNSRHKYCSPPHKQLAYARRLEKA